MSLINQVLGPSYSYPKNLPSAKKMRFRKAKTVKDVAHNTKGILKYVELLSFGPAYGNNFFLKSGRCDESSVPQCRNQDRYLYVRNIPTGKIPCIGDPGISLDGGIGARGIIPGLMEDAADLNPLELPKTFLGMSKKFGNKCVQKSLITGGVNENQKVETRCTPDAPVSGCPFFGGGKPQKKKYTLEKLFGILIFLIILWLFLFLLFGKNSKNRKTKKIR